MTELRKRMIETLQLRGLSKGTQELYVRAVNQLAQHYHKSPDLITEEELRQYFLYIKNVKNYSRASMTIALCAIKSLVEWTLGRKWQLLDVVRPPARRSFRPCSAAMRFERSLVASSNCATGYVSRLSTRAGCGWPKQLICESRISIATG